VEKKESIIRDVKNDLRNVVRLQEQIPIVKSQTESAEKKLKIANFRFDRGLASNFDIVDAENNLILARQTITKSIADYLVAKYQLKRDMGVLKEEDLETP
jgi:outer membrane protein TolC